MTSHARSDFRTALLAALMVSGSVCAALAAPVPLPMEKATDVNGITATCTGAGSNDRRKADAKAYPLKLEFVGGYGQYLGQETVDVASRGGHRIVSVSCSEPWVLMRLTPGRYRISADVPGGMLKTRWVHVTASNAQRRVIFRYPSFMDGAPAGRTASSGV